MINDGEHLWDPVHEYYCNEGNFCSNECHYAFKSWADFVGEEGGGDSYDLDYNLVFRWDWKEGDSHPEKTVDPYYRGDILQIFVMQQRKGRFVCVEIEVCRADEDAVIEWLKPRHAHLMKLWAPFGEFT